RLVWEGMTGRRLSGHALSDPGGEAGHRQGEARIPGSLDGQLLRQNGGLRGCLGPGRGPWLGCVASPVAVSPPAGCQVRSAGTISHRPPGRQECRMTWADRDRLAAQETRMGYVDAHVHVWTDDLAHYPLAPGHRREDMKPPRFTPEDLFKHM